MNLTIQGENKLGMLDGIFNMVASMWAANENRNAVIDTNKANKEINQQQLDYHKALTQAQWERDDNVHQREVADLEKAGLSPLANTTGNPVTSAPAQPNMLAMQAPQFDMNSAINSALQATKIGEEIRHNKVEEGYKDTELSQQAQKIQQTAMSLQIENKKVMADIKHQADLIKLQNDQLEETIRSNKSNEALKKAAYLSERTFKETKEQVGSDDLPAKHFYKNQFDEYVVYSKLWNVEYEHWLQSHDNHIVGSQGENSSKSQNAGGGLTVTGSGINGQAGYTESKGTYKSWNDTEIFKADERKFFYEHHKPVYHDFDKPEN